jgi:hypothetical protein
MYIGQTGRNFKARFRERIKEIRNNKSKTGYAQHILDTGHKYGKLEDTMETKEVQYKGSHLNTIEKFHIYDDKVNGLKIFNDNLYKLANPIFDVCK